MISDGAMPASAFGAIPMMNIAIIRYHDKCFINGILMLIHPL
jgi:hypothetical protein